MNPLRPRFLARQTHRTLATYALCIASIAQTHLGSATVISVSIPTTTPVRIGTSEGLIFIQRPPDSPTERLAAPTSWPPTIADVRRAERYLSPRLRSRFRTSHPERIHELRAAKRHYVGVILKGRRVLLVVGYRPKGPVVSSGQWARPLLLTDLPGDWNFAVANILFMAWLTCEPEGFSVERFWPEGKAWEYDAITTLLPALRSELLRVANQASNRELRPHLCHPPSYYEIKVNSHDEYTEAAYLSCPIQSPYDGPHKEEFSIYATGTIRRYGAVWRLADTSVHTSTAHTR